MDEQDIRKRALSALPAGQQVLILDRLLERSAVPRAELRSLLPAGVRAKASPERRRKQSLLYGANGGKNYTSRKFSSLLQDLDRLGLIVRTEDMIVVHDRERLREYRRLVATRSV
jgi:hypothetical protein